MWLEVQVFEKNEGGALAQKRSRLTKEWDRHVRHPPIESASQKFRNKQFFSMPDAHANGRNFLKIRIFLQHFLVNFTFIFDNKG